ncbi:MAG: hypothetical protein QOK12_2764 [Mycobacterium sp.]|nr:hypothetical protein [Mycobacterium sp.]
MQVGTRQDPDCSTGTVDRLVTQAAIELAYHDCPDGDEAVIGEGKLALTRYLETYGP